MKLLTMRMEDGTSVAANADDISAIVEVVENRSTVHMKNGTRFIVGLAMNEIIERIKEGGAVVEII